MRQRPDGYRLNISDGPITIIGGGAAAHSCAAVLHGDGDAFTAWYGRDGVTVGVLTHQRDSDDERGTKLVAAAAPFPPRNGRRRM